MGRSRIISLELRRWNLAEVNPLENNSASWAEVEINLSKISLRTTFSLVKWLSTSTCLVRAWNTGLVARDNAPRLLHRSIGGQGRGIRRSLSSIRSQYNSAVTIAMDQYSDSILDWDTTSCFFALQEIKQGPRKTAKPVVDLSSTSPAQSESRNAFRIKNPCQSRDHDEVSLWDILTLAWLLTNEQ